MNLSTKAINLFEELATNAHHKITTDKLLANQPAEIKEIYLSNNSEHVKNHFSTTGYFADSIKVTEI
jgi:hypothetical protein